MTIDPTDPRPPYRQIADELRAAIYARRLAPGERIPSERELVERYGTAAQTVRQAISVLKSEGLVIGQPGRGVFVRELRSRRFRLDAPRLSLLFITQAKAQGRAGEVRLLDVQVVAAPVEVAAKLNLDPSAEPQALVRRYLLLLDGEPAQLVNSSWPLALVDGTPIAGPAHLTPARIDAALKERHGIGPGSYLDELMARMPTADETRALRLLPGTPVVRILRSFHDTAGNPFEINEFVLAGDKHVLVYEGMVAT